MTNPDFLTAKYCRYLLWLFWITLALQCWSQVYVILENGSSFKSMLFRWGVEIGTLISLDKALSQVFVLTTLCMFFRNALAWGLWLLSGLYLLLSISTVVVQEHDFASVAPIAHGIRILMPIALFYYLRQQQGEYITRILWVLKVGVSLTFATHGVECLMENQKFIDYIIDSSKNLIGLKVAKDQAITTLFWIGWMDVILAILLLCKPAKWVAIHMAFWGAVAALSRVTSGGWDQQWQESAIRIANSTGALWLYLYWCWAERKR